MKDQRGDAVEGTSRPRLFDPIWALAAAVLFLCAKALPFLKYLVSNPGSLGAGSLSQVVGHCIDLPVAAFVLAGCAGHGATILEIFRLETNSRLERFLFSAALGEAFFSLLMLLLGLLGLYRSPIFIALAALLFYGIIRQRSLLAGTVRDIGGLFTQKVAWPTLAAYTLIAIALLRGAAGSGAPPTDWDSLAYHLAFPKIFLQEGRFLRLPWSINAHYPLNTEMLYTFALAVRNDLTAQWINWLHGILLLAAVYAAGRRHFSRMIGLGAAAALAVQPVFQRVSGNASTDFPVALASMLAISAALQMQESEDPAAQKRLALLAGLLCGAAMGMKLSGVWVFTALLVFMSLHRAFGGRAGARNRVAAFAGGAAILSWPWYLKNLILTGNPIWPYLGDWMGASGPDLAAWHRIRDSVTEGMGKGFWDFLLLPGRLIAHPDRFWYAPHYVVAPFFILLLFRLMKKEPFRDVEKKALGLLIIFTLLWFSFYQGWRYFLPLAGWLAVLGAAWAAQRRRGTYLAPLVLGAALFCLIPAKDISPNNEAFGFFGLRSPQAPGSSPRNRYLEHGLGAWHEICMAANQSLPANARLLLYRDVRGYYLDRPYAWGDPLNPGVVHYADILDPRSLRRALKAEGFTHVLFNPSVGNYQGDQDYYKRADLLMMGFLRADCRPAVSIKGLRIYEIL